MNEHTSHNLKHWDLYDQIVSGSLGILLGASITRAYIQFMRGLFFHFDCFESSCSHVLRKYACMVFVMPSTTFKIIMVQ